MHYLALPFKKKKIKAYSYRASTVVLTFFQHCWTTLCLDTLSISCDNKMYQESLEVKERNFFFSLRLPTQHRKAFEIPLGLYINFSQELSLNKFSIDKGFF